MFKGPVSKTGPLLFTAVRRISGRVTIVAFYRTVHLHGPLFYPLKKPFCAQVLDYFYFSLYSC